MIRVKENMFSEAQAVTATAAGDNILFVGAANDIDKRLRLFVQVREAGTAAGEATLTLALLTGTTAAGCSTTLWTSATIPVADLTAGKYIHQDAIPAGGKGYYKLTYTVATGPLTAGTFDAGIAWRMDER